MGKPSSQEGEQAAGDGSAKRARPTEYGMLTLKTCLSAICISRPELVTDPTKDYAVSAVDPYESSLQPQHSSPDLSASTSNLGRGGQGLMEGKGMLSWNLAEKREGTTWVCGRVVQTDNGRRGGPRSGKRRKLDDDEDDGEREDEEDEDESEEEEGMNETLEVWLQLVERTSFTQTQFLTSLRSFANPAQPQPSSDRASSPPFRRRPPLPQQQTSKQPSLGDPVKKKRPRDATSVPRLPTAPTVAPPALSNPLASTSTLASLQDPQVVALLAQLLPSLGLPSGPLPVPSTTATPFALDTPQGRALLPAIRTLAKFYGVSLPEGTPAAGPPPPPTAADKGKGREQVAPVPSLAAPSASLPSTTAPSPAEAPVPPPKRPGPKRKGSAKPKSRDEAFVALTGVAKGNLNPLDPNAGCFNCNRRKSTVWREGEGDDGLTVTVCNACGTFFNKHGHHRSTGDRTSPAAKTASSKLAQASASTSRAGSTSSVGRPLQGRLTATCEADLKKTKRRRTKGHGFVAPPSPSKHVGPSQRLSPTSIFRHGPTALSSHRAPGQSQFLTSPGGRSPRFRTSARNAAATSPLRRSGGGGAGLGLRSGYQSDGDERGAMDFSNLFNIHHSPSPSHSKHVMPEYLLTASPGTALARILNDTSVDMDHFDVTMGDALERIHGQPRPQPDEDHDLSFYVRTSPTDEKENAVPALEDGHLTTDGAGTNTDYDSLLSSLRRDFDTRMSSTALTAPSSPPASSPCVQPRTSSATPGQKSKQPASCGRPAPSILDSFIDTLVPAFTLNALDGETPASDSDAWTPASTSGEQDQDRTMMQLDPMSEQSAYGGHNLRHPPIPFHLSARLGSAAATSDDFDFGSLPPSSPPALPSEAIPTPSEFDSGVTPDGEGYHDSDYDAYQPEGVYDDDPEKRQHAVAALVQSLGGSASLFGAVASLDGSDKVSLDRSTVAQLLQMISANNSLSGSSAAPQGAVPALAPVDAYVPAPFDIFGGKDIVPTPAPVPDADDEQLELNDLYQSLFSDSRAYNDAA
ncbi:hypothetical protein RQP46_000390 [Phenoliferia psychrophenolica]